MDLRNFTLFTLFLFSVIVVRAQETPEALEELVTDRPDETESPSVVPKGSFQSGIAYEEWEYSAVTEKEWTWNTTLLRYGLMENLELRLGTDVVQFREELAGTTLQRFETGFKPLLIGAKLAIAEEKGILPETGLLVHALLPFAASEQYRPDETGFDLRFAFSHTINENAEIAYNLGAEWHDDHSRPVYIYTLAFEHDLSDKWGLFVEVYGDIESRESPEHFWDGGLTYLIAHNFQLDAFVGTGINNEQRLRAGAGLSYRIPQ